MKSHSSPQKIAVCPGTFDPVTCGHLDILREASLLFDKVVGAVGVNPEKSPMFSLPDRLEMLQQAVAAEGFDNVVVVSFNGLTVDCAREHNATFIVRGLRAVTDFEHEMGLVLANEQLDPAIKTVFVLPGHKHLYLSSSVVRQAATLGERIIPNSVPECVEMKLKEKFGF